MKKIMILLPIAALAVICGVFSFLLAKPPDAEKVLIDVKSLYPMEELRASRMRVWRL